MKTIMIRMKTEENLRTTTGGAKRPRVVLRFSKVFILIIMVFIGFNMFEYVLIHVYIYIYIKTY